MKSNIRVPQARTHEGAPSPILDAERQLHRSVMSNMLFEDEFYEDGQSITERISSLCSQVSFDALSRAAVDARERFKLRHVPLILLREALRHPSKPGRKTGDLIARVIQRPDEMGELLALYRKTGGKGEPAQLKQGIARAFGKFSEYQLAKYRGDEAEFKLRDVLFLCHAKPKDEAQTALYKKVAENTLETPDTWEVGLSTGGDKKETFERLLSENKLGALALLRNLRNMIQAGVSEDLIRSSLARMKTERVLPFRFITAAKYAPRLEDALEEAMMKCLAEAEKLTGKTALLVDHSASMDQVVSAKSEVTRFQAAAALGMILREKSERVRIFTFSDRLVEIAPRRGFGMYAALNAVRKPAGTLLGSAVKAVYKHFPECERIIIITDEQSADRPPHPQGRGYIINVASNAQGIAYGPWLAIDGWSEAVLDFIREYEAEG
jgi:60 kDa SS-A/Ro ribonucleoprotein